MADRICTYKNYLSVHPDRFAHQLFGTSKGRSTLLGVTHVSLEITEYVLSIAHPSYGNVHQALDTLSDVKLIHEIAQVPFDLLALHRRTLNMHQRVRAALRLWKEGDRISKKEIVLVAIAASKVAYKTLSLIAHACIKPMKLLEQHKLLDDDRLHNIVKSWDYLSLARSGCKIGYLGGKIALSSKQTFPRAFQLSLEICELVLGGLKLCRYRVHPCLNLACSVSKSLLGVYRLWLKTI